MPIFILAIAIALAVLAVGAHAQPASTISAAPAGDPAVVALRVIRENFSSDVCPRMNRASRVPDGSIRGTCSNGETFRIFTLSDRAVAMRCSAAAALGIEGC